METLTETPSTDLEKVLAQKKDAWGSLGVNIHKADLKFQGWAQQEINKLKIPTKIEEVQEAEIILSSVKKQGDLIKAERLKITNPVKERMSQLMLSEESFEEPVKKVEAAIISLKRAEEARKAEESQKAAKKSACREFLTIEKNNADAFFKAKIIDTVNKAYEYALGDGNITMEKLERYLGLCKAKLTDIDFKNAYPMNSFSPSVSNDEFVAMCAELLIIDPVPYLEKYHKDLDARFSDYEVALNNKEIALAKSKVEAAAQAENIQTEKANLNVGAKIETLSVDLVVDSGLKALKKSYEVDMEESVQSAMLIMSAFITNAAICSQETSTKKWFAFSVSSMATTLSKVKSKNNDFEPKGIKFKIVEKL